MRLEKKLIGTMALAAGLAVVASAPAAAAGAVGSLRNAAAVAPANIAPAGPALSGKSLVEKAQYRGRRGFRSFGPRYRSFRYRRGFVAPGGYYGWPYRRRGSYWRGGRWIGPLIGGAIIGGALASRPSYGYARGSSAWERCDARYRSFRWSDGTFQPYGGGPRQLCPYLR